MSKMGMTLEQIAQAVGEKADIVERWLEEDLDDPNGRLAVFRES